MPKTAIAASRNVRLSGEFSYITKMLLELRELAKKEDSELAYFIAMACEHAKDLDRGIVIPSVSVKLISDA